MTPSGITTERHYVEKDGGTHEIMVLSPLLGESSQAPAEEDALWITPNDCWQPPLDLHRLAEWSGINTIRGAAIRAIVRNTVGQHLNFAPAEDLTEPRDDHQTRADEVQARLDAAARRDKRSRLIDFTDLMERVGRDREECGNGAMEISRSKLTGEIDGLFYLPGARIRRLRDRTGWIMLDIYGSMSKAVRFYNFGEKVIYDQDGRPTPKLLAAGGGRWAKNELLPFQLHTSESRDYGLPRDVAMALEYLGDKLAAESNVGFFDSSGTPPTVIFVTAETEKDGRGRTTFKVPQDTALRVANTLKSDGAHKHRVAIIPLPPNSKTEKHELGTQAERDMGFVQYRQDLRGLTLAAMNLSGLFVAMGGDTRLTAEVDRALTLEQLFDPEQGWYERYLRHTLLRDLGYFDLQPQFKRLAVEGDQAKRTGAVAMSSVRAITNREFRKAHGYGPLPEIEIGDVLIDGRTVTEKGPPPPPPPVPPVPPADPAAPPAPAKVAKATKVPPPDPAADPAAPAPDAPPAPEEPTEIGVADVTLEEAAMIGKVPVGWNDALTEASHSPNQAPSRGGNPVDPALDHRGLPADVGSRPRQRADNVPGTSVAQGAGRLQTAVQGILTGAAGTR